MPDTETLTFVPADDAGPDRWRTTIYANVEILDEVLDRTDPARFVRALDRELELVLRDVKQYVHTLPITIVDELVAQGRL